MSLPMNQVGEEKGNFTSERNNCKGGERFGEILEKEILHCSNNAEKVVITAYLLFASVFSKGKLG